MASVDLGLRGKRSASTTTLWQSEIDSANEALSLACCVTNVEMSFTVYRRMPLHPPLPIMTSAAKIGVPEIKLKSIQRTKE